MLALAAPEAVARRLRLLRLVSGLNSTDYAQRAEIGIQAWSNYESGRRRISVDAALRLLATYHVTLDYVYIGEVAGLPRTLRLALKSVSDHVDAMSSSSHDTDNDANL